MSTVMAERETTAGPNKTGLCGALLTLFGILVSGPPALLLVNATHPQPPWQSAELFAKNFHPVQTLPFFGGFFLIGGFVLLLSSLHAIANKQHRAWATSALVFASAYAAMISINYTIQTTFVPELARHYSASNDALLAAFSMTNPASLAWGIEMWGYGLLGVATWLASPVFGNGRIERATAWTFAANGPASVVPAVLTALRPGWVMTRAGIASFIVWNVLVVAMCVLATLVFWKQAAPVSKDALAVDPS
jgi:hypothetical protein